jgi:hypothetical protein
MIEGKDLYEGALPDGLSNGTEMRGESSNANVALSSHGFCAASLLENEGSIYRNFSAGSSEFRLEG